VKKQVDENIFPLVSRHALNNVPITFANDNENKQG